MKLDVPFYKQTTHLNCGPMALRMVLSYFGEEHDLKLIEEKTGLKEGKGISTIQIATAAALFGFRTNFYSKHLTFNEENLKLEFYQKYADMMMFTKQLVDEARVAGVRLEERGVSLEEIEKFVTNESVPIILIDWNAVRGIEGKYQGHFVPIVGYDSENIYVHNHGMHEPTAFLPIKKDVFDKARKAEGTDEDIVVIWRR